MCSQVTQGQLRNWLSFEHFCDLQFPQWNTLPLVTILDNTTQKMLQGLKKWKIYCVDERHLMKDDEMFNHFNECVDERLNQVVTTNEIFGSGFDESGQLL